MRVQRKFCEGAAWANADTLGLVGCAVGGRLVAQLESFRLKPKGSRANLMVLTDCFDDAKICNFF